MAGRVGPRKGPAAGFTSATPLCVGPAKSPHNILRWGVDPTGRTCYARDVRFRSIQESHRVSQVLLWRFVRAPFPVGVALSAWIGLGACAHRPEPSPFVPTVEERYLPKVSADNVLFLDSFDFSEWKKIGIITLQTNTYQEGIQLCRHHAALNGGEAISEYKVLNQQSGVRNVVTPTTTTQTTSETSNDYASQMAADLQKQTGTSQSLQMKHNNNNSTVQTYSNGGSTTSIPFSILDVQCSVLARLPEPEPEPYPEKTQITGVDADSALRPTGERWFCRVPQGEDLAGCSRHREDCLAGMSGKGGKKTSCKPQKRAYCVTFRGETQGVDFACSPTMEKCQDEREMKLDEHELTDISNCTAW